MRKPPAPLFRDPIFDGAADPAIIWNRQTKSWLLFYTQRRANVDSPGVAYCHGCGIGIAESKDGGQTWIHIGNAEGLPFERGLNTFWAPEVIENVGVYHMYCSYVPGCPSDWIGERQIHHYTSTDLFTWKHQSKLPLSSNKVIDACVLRMPTGQWRLWYKDEAYGSHTYAADSSDLFNWKIVGPIITDCPHEGPNVFFWKGSYWLITDPWRGLGVYQSLDAVNWTQQTHILALPGKRPEDGYIAGHADVLVNDGRAFIFYFLHPGRNQDHREVVEGVEPYASRRTVIQVAELELENGKIVCDRDKDFDFCLVSPRE